jgi:CubicO group peptidase (beta-lactamase class C family)
MIPMSGTSGFSKARLDRLRNVMAGHVESGDMPGLVTLLSRRGEIHVDAIGRLAFYGQPMARDTIFRIASMTKPVTAAAAMILVEESKLRLDDPVDRWLPELANREVLRAIDALIFDTVPAKRAYSRISGPRSIRRDDCAAPRFSPEKPTEAGNEMQCARR